MPTSNRQYAASTSLTVGRTKDAIVSELQRLGASRRAFYDDENSQAMNVFEMRDRRYRFILPFPDPRDETYKWTLAGRLRRGVDEARAAWTQDCQARWRGLAEYIKAMRIAHELQIIRISEALRPYVVFPNDQTISQWLDPQVAEAYATHEMPPLLPGPALRSQLLIQITVAESKEE